MDSDWQAHRLGAPGPDPIRILRGPESWGTRIRVRLWPDRPGAPVPVHSDPPAPPSEPPDGPGIGSRRPGPAAVALGPQQIPLEEGPRPANRPGPAPRDARGPPAPDPGAGPRTLAPSLRARTHTKRRARPCPDPDSRRGPTRRPDSIRVSRRLGPARTRPGPESAAGEGIFRVLPPASAPRPSV